MQQMTLSDGTVATYSEIRRMIAKADLVTGGGAPSADQQVDQAVKTLMTATGRSYSEALSVVMTTNPSLKRAWLAESRGGRR